MSESLYKMGWQFSCNLQTGINIKDLSPEKFTVFRFSMKMSVSLYKMGL